MFSFFRKKKKAVSVKSEPPKFEVNSPKFTITRNAWNLEAALDAAGIDYRVVTKGYIVFQGSVFERDIPLMIGIHHNGINVVFIELFRPEDYYASVNYDVNVSFAELSEALKNEFGEPEIVTSQSIDHYPREQWLTSDFIINHYIMDRFGPEEHLHINFFQR